MPEPPISSGSEERELLNDRQAFANRLAQTFEPRQVIALLLTTGLRYSDLALALKVHPREPAGIDIFANARTQPPLHARPTLLFLFGICHCLKTFL